MHKGVAVSPGVVVGVAHRVESVFGSGEPVGLADPALVPMEIERFDRAVSSSASELEGIVQKVARQLGSSEAAIFRTHLTIVKDESLLEKVRTLVRTQGLTALSALQQVLQGYAATFAQHEHDFFRERMADVRDVISRIGSHLSLPAAASGAKTADDLPGDGAGSEDDEPIILVAHEILPSQAMSLGSMAIAGIVTEVGGGTSHVAILARSRGIPAVSGCVGVTADVQSGDIIIVDGRDGVVQIRPDAEMIAAYRKMQREFFHLKDKLILNRDQPAASADGVAVDLLANINNMSDAHAAVQVGSTGVGLFRTEYLFLAHHDVPDEEEQFEHYRQMIEASPNKTVTIRTLDLGGDKTVPYLGRRNEANPFMGWRSIRMSFEHPRMFEKQIRAILRGGSVRQYQHAVPDDHDLGRIAASQQDGRGHEARFAA